MEEMFPGFGLFSQVNATSVFFVYRVACRASNGTSEHHWLNIPTVRRRFKVDGCCPRRNVIKRPPHLSTSQKRALEHLGWIRRYHDIHSAIQRLPCYLHRQYQLRLQAQGEGPLDNCVTDAEVIVIVMCVLWIFCVRKETWKIVYGTKATWSVRRKIFRIEFAIFRSPWRDTILWQRFCWILSDTNTWDLFKVNPGD